MHSKSDVKKWLQRDGKTWTGGRKLDVAGSYCWRQQYDDLTFVHARQGRFVPGIHRATSPGTDLQSEPCATEGGEWWGDPTTTPRSWSLRGFFIAITSAYSSILPEKCSCSALGLRVRGFFVLFKKLNLFPYFGILSCICFLKKLLAKTSAPLLFQSSALIAFIFFSTSTTHAFLSWKSFQIWSAVTTSVPHKLLAFL